MKYKTKEFIKFLGTSSGTFHIYVRIDDTQDKYNRTGAMPARNSKFVKTWDSRAQVYVSVNPCRMMTKKPKIGDVTHWTCEYIDLDCERPDHSVPATDKELDVLKPEIERINEWLVDHGFLCGYQDFTGNGARWLLPIPVMDLRKMRMEDVMKINEQKKEWLRILKSETDTNVDTSVGEFSRITGIPGTINVKARDGRDRRREFFRGCDRVEDVALRDYIIDLDISKDEYIPEVADWRGTSNDILEVVLSLDTALQTMFEKAPLIKGGHRSGYDYAIMLKLCEWKISPQDCIDILRQHGTSKAQIRKDDYVKRTVMSAYMDVVIK